MKKFLYILLIFLGVAVTSCNNISDDPKEAAHQYLEQMAEAASNNDYSKGEETTIRFLEKYNNDGQFVAVLINEMKKGNYMQSFDFMRELNRLNYEKTRELMIEMIAWNQAFEQNGVNTDLFNY